MHWHLRVYCEWSYSDTVQLGDYSESVKDITSTLGRAQIVSINHHVLSITHNHHANPFFSQDTYFSLSVWWHSEIPLLLLYASVFSAHTHRHTPPPPDVTYAGCPHKPSVRPLHLWESNMNKGQRPIDIQTYWGQRQRESIRDREKKTVWGSRWHLQFKVLLRLHIHNNTLFPLVTSSLFGPSAELAVTDCVCVCLNAHISFNLYLPRKTWQSSVQLFRNTSHIQTGSCPVRPLSAAGVEWAAAVVDSWSCSWTHWQLIRGKKLLIHIPLNTFWA